MKTNMTPTAHSMEVIHRSTLEFNTIEDLKKDFSKFNFEVGDIVKIRSNGKVEYRELSEAIDLDSIIWEKAPGVTMYWNLVEFSSRKYTFGTIEEMKKAKYLKEGDVIELLGFYTAGDGAGHKRKICGADDGSGEVLDNGKWACIVHDGEINVSWFGAKGDGITDNCFSFTRSVAYGSLNTIKIKLGSGRFLTSKSIVINGNTTITGIAREKSIIEFTSMDEQFGMGVKEFGGRMELTNFTIYGDGKSSGGSKRGIYISKIDGGDSYGLIQNVRVRGFSGDGIYVHTDVRELRVLNCVSENNGAHGINANCNDSFFETCTTWGNYNSGIRASRGELRFIGCKSWYNGQSGSPYDTNFYGVSASELTIDSCTFQESYQHGCRINSCKAVNMSNVTFSFNGYMNLNSENQTTTYHLYIDDCLGVNISNACFTSKLIRGFAYTKRCIYLNNSENVYIDGLIDKDASLIGEPQVVYSSGMQGIDITTCRIDLRDSLEHYKYITKNNVNLVVNGNLHDWTPAHFTGAEIRDGKMVTVGKRLNFKTIKLKYDRVYLYAILRQLTGGPTRVNIEYAGSIWTDGTVGREYVLANSGNSAYVGNPKSLGIEIVEDNCSFEIIELGATYGKFTGSDCPMDSKAIPNTANFLKCFSTGLNLDTVEYTGKIVYVSGNNFTGTNVPSKDLSGILIGGYYGDSGCLEILSKQYYQDSVYVRTNKTGDYKKILLESIQTQLDTPYYTSKMQKEGVYEDFISYMDEKHAFDAQQREVQAQQETAYQEALDSNPELSFEDFLSQQPAVMTVIPEPLPSEALLAFKTKYLG